jgi:hypothetical protein
MPVRVLTPNAVAAFVRRKLRSKLEEDFSGRVFRIFRERDLHACSYFHLRRFFGNNSNWEILNEPLLRGLKGRNRGAHPDMALLRNGRLNFLLEFKFRRRYSGVQRKDQRVLRMAVRKKKWAKKVFYIEAVIQPKRKSRRHLIPYRSRIVTISMLPGRLQEYLSLYRLYRKPKPRRT